MLRYSVKFIAEKDGLARTVNGKQDLEFRKGDLLEYIGIGHSLTGAMPLLPAGKHIVLTRDVHMTGWENVAVRHVAPSYSFEFGRDQIRGFDPRIVDSGRGRVGRVDGGAVWYFSSWPPIPGVVQSVTPLAN